MYSSGMLQPIPKYDEQNWDVAIRDKRQSNDARKGENPLGTHDGFTYK